MRVSRPAPIPSPRRPLPAGRRGRDAAALSPVPPFPFPRRIAAMNAITDTILQHQDSDLYFTFKATGDPDAGFVVTSFRAVERVSELYEIEIELASRRSD